ncbi:IclR family transcriptional regulator [Paenibacillus validus]|uniref:Helix-turn-helix domain-containing protein n=1 Tax=Paenibacillus validus TaxID=44253 RepID=A0A7X2Z6X6_9BACL|nr:MULTISPECIES: IclR family transcriptional regulator [Paenibacillus]MED4602823.1 IclR family transcriptional regulator [Paenibacillus validus]MED4607335.1 IclR family transcriptional regulator [Paenibacillus validus]MUG69392.1 helix-turn-helix domain-containing protein [Paenibacillus validus]
MAQQVPLSSVYNAIRILREFTLEDEELGITELSQRLGLAKSTIFRLVNTLYGNNLVEKNMHTHKYHLGIGAFELGFAAYHRNELRLIAYPLLNKLMSTVREAVHLAVYDHGEIVFLSKMVPDYHQGTVSKIGKRIPSYCSASGKVLLANQSEQEIDRVIQQGLYRHTPKTITDGQTLTEHLRDVLKNGYAIGLSEYNESVCSIAVPVYNDTGQVIAAISLAMIKSYLYPAQIQNYVKELKTYSRLITERLS